MLSRLFLTFAFVFVLGTFPAVALSQTTAEDRAATPSTVESGDGQAASPVQPTTDVPTADLPENQTPKPPPIGAGLLDSLRTTFDRTTWVGWSILFLGIFAGVVAGRIVQTILRRLSEKFQKHGWVARGSIFRYAAGPANLCLIGIGLGAGLNAGPVLEANVKTFAMRTTALISVIALAWFLYNLVDLIEFALRRITQDNTIIQLIRKALRIFMLVVFGLFIAQNFFGANITAWLAGLGLAGLAVSLAAQGPIKNIFGSVTIVLDRPFGIGDAIKYAGYTGTVETMGFRSTKLRTPEGHLVTIPNSKLIDDVVENISIRTSIRRVLDLGIAYDTPPQKIEASLQILQDLLNQPFMSETFDLAANPPQVHFTDLKADSLTIQAIYWYQLNKPNRDPKNFLAQAQEFNLQLMRAFAAAGIEFAFPTRTLFLANDPNRRLALSVESNGHEARQRHSDPHSALQP